jgi:hypothetical protein
MANQARGRLGSIPSDHDVLGAPNQRDQQGGPNGETHFQQIRPSSGYSDITKSKPTHKGGDFKTTPGAGV